LGNYFPINTQYTINDTAQKVHISSQWIEIYFPAYKLGDLILPATSLVKLIWFTKVHEMGDGRWEMGDGS
jgi:hypothetical protein